MSDKVTMPSYQDFCNEAKGLFNGEFHFEIPDFDEDGFAYSRKITVPWTTIKEIYKLAVTEYGQPIPQTKETI